MGHVIGTYARTCGPATRSRLPRRGPGQTTCCGWKRADRGLDGWLLPSVAASGGLFQRFTASRPYLWALPPLRQRHYGFLVLGDGSIGRSACASMSRCCGWPPSLPALRAVSHHLAERTCRQYLPSRATDAAGPHGCGDGAVAALLLPHPPRAPFNNRRPARKLFLLIVAVFHSPGVCLLDHLLLMPRC